MVARRFAAREMMYGWRHRFSYRECGDCGSLQIEQVPANLPEYYSGDYYSLAVPAPRRASAARCAWARWLLRRRGALRDRITRALRRKTPFFRWGWLAGVGVDAAILDVGCGSGGLLRRMQRYGFTHLDGVDPYTRVEVAEPGFRIARGGIDRVAGRFDLVMFNHVLEHVADPVAELRRARGLLTSRGRILVRVPVAGSRISREYGEHWYNLDPPRHLVVPSRKGMGIAAARAALRLVHVEFDSEEGSFLNSEHYRHDIPSKDAPRPSPSLRLHYRRLAWQYNRSGDGDWGVFLLAAA